VVTEYQQGHKTGLYEFRNEKGILVTRGTFEKSHPVGTWTNYHDTGVVSSERVWRGGKVKIAAANNPQGTALVTAGNGTFSEGTTKIQVKDSMKVGTVNYTDASSGLGTFSVTYAAGGGFTVQNTEGGGSSATTTPPKMGMDQKIQFFTAPFSHASMPDPSELFPVDIEPNPLNLDQVKMSIGYPTIAKENDIQGKVLVKVLVDEKGKVACALLLRNPNPILSNAVLAKMDNLKFAPGGWEGQPTMCWVTLPFEFKLMN
jgi:TonB family protein